MQKQNIHKKEVVHVSLLNCTQRIVIADDQVKIVSDGDFVVCEGKSIDECIGNLMAMLKQECLQRA